MALIKCHECGKEISGSASSCPGCGAPVAAAKPGEGDFIPYTDQEVAVMLSKKKKTSHVLHLLMSVITAGIWILFWMLAATSNSSENAKIYRRIKKGKKT